MINDTLVYKIFKINQGKNALLERRTLVEAKFMARLKWIKAKVYLLADVGIKSKDWVL